MDVITATAASVNEPLLRTIGLLLDDSMTYGLVLLGLLLVGEQRQGKLAKIMLTVALALLLAIGLKNTIADQRPCIGQEGCPDDFAFPSLHATTAFTLMIAFLNKRSYIVYFAFALFVCFTRLNLGMHDFQDIAGALPVAVLSYYAVDAVWRIKEGKDGV